MTLHSVKLPLRPFAEILRTSELEARMQRRYEDAIETMKREVLGQQESLLQAFIAGEAGDTPFRPEEVATRGHLTGYPDGVLEFVWDGHPRLRFFPVKFVNIEGTMKPVQQFEMVPAPPIQSEPEEVANVP